MKTLVLMRHAKTENHNVGGDKARELTDQGRAAAAAAGSQLAGLGLQYALVSSSTRTRQTFEALGLDIPAEFQDALYEGGTATVLQRISEIDDEVTGLLVVGHAPTIPGLSAHLAYQRDRDVADELQCHFPTSAFTVFQVDGSWSDLEFDADNAVSLKTVNRP